MSTRLLINVLLLTLFLMHVAGAKEKQLSIGLIGDSTVASTYGWGPAFALEVKDHVQVLNYAKNGATLDALSTKLDALLRQKPHYVIVQFGHNDMKRYAPKAYGKKLKNYLQRIKNAGSQAIVFSSVTRRNFDDNGKIVPRIINARSLQNYAQEAQAIAKEMKVPFINLNAISIAHHNKIGPKVSATYNFTKTDTTHFSKIGAKAISALIIKELKITVPELVTYLK